jgi:beta-galactosidase/beta-glucuronidase
LTRIYSPLLIRFSWIRSPHDLVSPVVRRLDRDLRSGDRPADHPVPATVPGCVHTDLLAAELIPDPYLDANELQLAWIGRTDWLYQCRFNWTETASGDQAELVCAGLDTVATVRVNGTELARTSKTCTGSIAFR